MPGQPALKSPSRYSRPEKVLALIETKRAGAAPRPGAEKRRLAPVVDLMTALKQSLAEKERARPTLVPSKPASEPKKEP